MVMKLRRPSPATILITVFFRSNFPGKIYNRTLQTKYHFWSLKLTCPSLNDDDELDAVGLVEGPPALLVEVGVPEVPAVSVQQSEVVPGGKICDKVKQGNM